MLIDLQMKQHSRIYVFHATQMLAKKRAMLGGSTSEGGILPGAMEVYGLCMLFGFMFVEPKPLVLRRDMVTSFSLKAFPWRHAQESFVRPVGKGYLGVVFSFVGLKS